MLDVVEKTGQKRYNYIVIVIMIMGLDEDMTLQEVYSTKYRFDELLYRKRWKVDGIKE